MITKSFVFITLLSFLGCQKKNQEDCRIDQEFKRNFENCLRIAELRATYEIDNNKLDLTEFSKAFNCLEALTGRKNSASWNDVGFGAYDSIEGFKKDQQVWLDWYEKYKCSITMDSSELIFAKQREPLPNYDDSKVMEKIALLWPENYKDSVRRVDSIQHVKFRIDWPSVNFAKNPQ
jgi:hypothetical protein